MECKLSEMVDGGIRFRHFGSQILPPADVQVPPMPILGKRKGSNLQKKPSHRERKAKKDNLENPKNEKLKMKGAVQSNPGPVGPGHAQ